jgi:hypothetical protein
MAHISSASHRNRCTLSAFSLFSKNIRINSSLQRVMYVRVYISMHLDRMRMRIREREGERD